MGAQVLQELPGFHGQSYHNCTTVPSFCCPQRTFYSSSWIWSWDLATAQSPEPCVCRYGFIHHGFRLVHLFGQMARSRGYIGDKGWERTSPHHLPLTCRDPASIHLCCLHLQQQLKAEPIPPSSQSNSHSLMSQRHWPTVLSENFKLKMWSEKKEHSFP